MRQLRLPLLVAGLCAAASALAQANPATPTAAPDVGFFRPQPADDPSLFHTLPPEAYAPPAPAQAPQGVQGAAAPSTAAPPVVVVVPDANRQTQEQLDRARLEAEQARANMARTPAPINGAFTGLTDERDR